eukprot:jgi/Picsp_1/4853/NSC_02218-R1_mdr-like abc transporter
MLAVLSEMEQLALLDWSWDRARDAELLSFNIIEETFDHIRSMKSYNLLQIFQSKYYDSLIEQRKSAVKQRAITGLSKGLTSGIFSFSYALAIWYGSLRIASDDYTGGQVLSILFSGVMAGFSLGQAMPNIRYVHEAIRAGMRLVAILEEPGTMIVQNEGLIPEDLHGDIEFDRVSFSFPLRPDKLILANLNMTISGGKLRQ